MKQVDIDATLRKIDKAIEMAEKLKPAQPHLLEDLYSVKNNVELLKEDFQGAPAGYIKKTAETLKKWS